MHHVGIEVHFFLQLSLKLREMPVVIRSLVMSCLRATRNELVVATDDRFGVPTRRSCNSSIRNVVRGKCCEKENRFWRLWDWDLSVWPKESSKCLAAPPPFVPRGLVGVLFSVLTMSQGPADHNVYLLQCGWWLDDVYSNLYVASSLYGGLRHILLVFTRLWSLHWRWVVGGISSLCTARKLFFEIISCC